MSNELPPDRVAVEPWSSHPSLLAKCPEPRALLYATVDEGDATYLVVLRAGTSPPRRVLEALESYRPILSTRAEIARNARRQWWEAAWPRNATEVTAPKVIALYRTDRGRFALDETGEWQPSIKSTLVVGRASDAPVAYLCGLLNSELLDLWYAVRGKTPWHVRRNYEPLRMNEMPYRRPDGDPRAEEVAVLVRAIGANRRALLPHRAVIHDLGRIVKDPWKDGPVVVDRPALIATLPSTEIVSVRLDPLLVVEEAPTGKATRVEADAIAFRRGGKETGRVAGDGGRLDLLQEIIGSRQIDDVASIVLPKDMASFERVAGTTAAAVQQLLAEGSEKVEQVERLVCALYAVPSALANEVVAHARRRAGSATPDE